MGVYEGQVGVGGGGSGFALGPEQNEFDTAALRNSYATANAAWLALYNADRSLWIQVGGVTGDIQRRNAAGDDWETVTGLIRGPVGIPGPMGMLSAAQLAEFARLSGVETAATQDQTGAEIKTAYEAEGDTNAYTDTEKSKLGGVAAAANRLVPYKIGNIYRAYATGATVTKPSNTEGTVTASGIQVAPTGWQLTRPEATAALPHVYDCHVYGYDTNSVFSWQFGTPNRTDRYIAPGGGGGTQNYFPILNANVGGTANAITLTTGQSITVLTGGMLFFFNSTLTNTGATTVNIDGIGTRSIQRSNFRLSGDVANTGSETLEGGEITSNDPIMLVYGSQFDEFYLLPSRAGTAAYRNVGTDPLDVIALDASGNLPAVDGSQLTGLPSGFDLQVDVPNPITGALSASDRFALANQNIAGQPTEYVTLSQMQAAILAINYLTVSLGLATQDRARELIQEALAAAVTGNTETNITVVHNADGTFDFAVIYPNQVTQAEAEAGTSNIARLWTSQRVAQAIEALAPGGQTTGLNQPQVDARVQAGLMAAVTGNTETGIDVSYNADGTFDFVVSGGTPTQTHLNYVGVRVANTNVVAGDLTVSGMTAALTLPAYTGAAHLIYSYPTAEGLPSAIYLYQDGHRNVQNQSSIFGITGTVMLGGEEHTWRVTDDAQTGFGGYILEQAR